MSISYRHAIALLLTCLYLGGCHSNNNSAAQIRILNTSIDYPSVDLYLSDGTTNTREIAGAAYGTLTPYLGVGYASYTVEFTNNNVQSSLKSVNENLAANTHRTYVAYGNVGKFGTLEILEDQTAAANLYTKVELLDAALDAGSVDVYIVDPSVGITNASPTFAGVAGGSTASAGFASITSGTYRIYVTATGSQTDIRLDTGPTGIVFANEGVMSIVITGTAGGLLVNAIVIPQQGTAAVYNTPYARVRAAAGIPAGSNLTANLGGVNLLGAAAANTVSQYSLVTAGAQTLNLTLSGTVLPVSSQTLAAGGDYTVLVLNGPAVSGTTTSLIADDNRLPSTSTYAEIKLVNAMSGLGDPLTLDVNYTPVVSAIALGTGSTSNEVTAGTADTEIDVVDATTSTTIFTNSNSPTLTLTSNGSTNGVYSLFMFGSASATVAALRTNR